jgi:hypothetical protein
MLNTEICPCQKCRISKWCILEQVKFQDCDQRNPINWCVILEQYKKKFWARQSQAFQ